MMLLPDKHNSKGEIEAYCLHNSVKTLVSELGLFNSSGSYLAL